MESKLSILNNMVKEVIKFGQDNFNVLNVLNAEQYIEMLAAGILGHSWVQGRGSDALDRNGIPAEYKSAEVAQKDGTDYDGNVMYKKYCSFSLGVIDKMFMERIHECDNYYAIVKDGGEIIEIWEIPTKGIIEFVNNTKANSVQFRLSPKNIEKWSMSLAYPKKSIEEVMEDRRTLISLRYNGVSR